MEENNKLVLMSLGDMQIVECDADNIEVQKVKVIPAGEYKTGTGEKQYFEERRRWELWGYYPSINLALKQIYLNDVLTPKEHYTLERYINYQTGIAQRLLNGK